MSSCSAQYAEQKEKVRVGAEVLLEQHMQELQGKRIGLAMNPTARVEGVHMLDTLISSGINITALFAAEHGFRGNVSAGEEIKDGFDIETGLPVFSLYGSTKKPTKEMLDEVDVILFDMQDVGARFYTYNVTLGGIIEEASKYGKEVWILDRPNPAGGDYVAGWLLEEEFESFVGAYPIPMAHGMTLGELMKMAIGEKWLSVSDANKIRVIEMENWEREMLWPDTGLDWVAPSPNLPSFEHAFVYLGTVLFEGTNVSEGRGTDGPFLTIGAPDLDYNGTWISELEDTFEVDIDTQTVTPKDIPGKVVNPKLEDIQIKAISIRVKDFSRFDPILFGSSLIQKVQGRSSLFQLKAFINNLSGIDLKNNLLAKELPSWDDDVKEFKAKRNQYLIY